MIISQNSLPNKEWNYIYRPFYHRCDFCGVKYDAIGFLETYDEDFRYIVQKLNLTSLLTHADKKDNQKSDSRQSQSDRIKEYFSLLKKEVRQRLYKLYRNNFGMLGFDANRYLWHFAPQSGIRETNLSPSSSD